MAASADSVIDDSRPLKIFIAGAGIGGLSVAIALRQAGHVVEVSKHHNLTLSFNSNQISRFLNPPGSPEKRAQQFISHQTSTVFFADLG
jgi:glycine/D-amino acid oxidase-like deaminating enzyme